MFRKRSAASDKPKWTKSGTQIGFDQYEAELQQGVYIPITMAPNQRDQFLNARKTCKIVENRPKSTKNLLGAEKSTPKVRQNSIQVHIYIKHYILPQISYSSSNFPNASAASPCSPITIYSIFLLFFNLLLFLNEAGQAQNSEVGTEVGRSGVDREWRRPGC